MTDFRIRLQVAEALGSLNRYYCSLAYCQEIVDHELLMRYYIKSGGAADFAKRYVQAMGQLNRYYCSQYYRRDIRDPEILWEYYMNYAPAGARGKEARSEAGEIRANMHIAC